MVLLVMLAGLAGCAGMASQSNRDDPGLADVRAKIAMGRCDEGLVAGLGRHRVPELDQEAAYICLQQGEVEAVEKILKDYSNRHRNGPHPDYSAYLLALAQQVRFELTENDDAARLREGRETHRRYADFVRTYPESEYRVEVGPRLNTLLEEMAQAEYRLAEAAVLAGDKRGAEARMQYILRYYPHSSVARQAGDWLENSAPEESENIPPGTAW